MTDCQDCTRSAAELWHGFRRDCSGCMARAVARSQQFSTAWHAGQQTRAYRTLCDQAGVTHDEVKAAHAVDVLTKGKAQK